MCLDFPGLSCWASSAFCVLKASRPPVTDWDSTGLLLLRKGTGSLTQASLQLVAVKLTFVYEVDANIAVFAGAPRSHSYSNAIASALLID